MAEIGDIANEFIREEVDEFLEKDDERNHIVDLFAQTKPLMQDIAAALIDGAHERRPLREGTLLGACCAGAPAPVRHLFLFAISRSAFARLLLSTARASRSKTFSQENFHLKRARDGAPIFIESKFASKTRALRNEKNNRNEICNENALKTRRKTKSKQKMHQKRAKNGPKMGLTRLGLQIHVLTVATAPLGCLSRPAQGRNRQARHLASWPSSQAGTRGSCWKQTR